MAQSKDRMIATQSQLKMTQEWAQSCGYCLTLKELVTISVVLTDYVENGYSKEIGERLQSVEDYLKKKGA
jgi:hypothetical protein